MTGRTRHAPPPYPLFLDIAGRDVLVVGGGAVAQRRVETLLESGASVTVVSPLVTPTLRELAHAGDLRWVERGFRAEDVSDQALAFAASGADDVDRAVAAAATARRVPVNVADDLDHCDFHVPAIARRGDIQIAVGTGGASPRLAARLRDRFAASLGPEWERFAGLLGEVRTLVRRRVADATERMRLMTRLADDDMLLASLARGSSPSAEDVLEGLVGQDPEREKNKPALSRVSIVGAGPGDPGLITVTGLERLRSADAVFYDDLVDRRLLEEAPEEAELIYTGKRGWRDGSGRPGPSELVRKANEGMGKHVVRLKGGDPSIFGRLTEETDALRRAGVSFTIVPGVTSALAAAAAAGLSLTRRGCSASVTFVSAVRTSTAPDGAAIDDIARIIGTGGTLVVHMGLRALSAMRRDLLASGVAPTLPVVVVQSASTPDERVVAGTLESIEQVVLEGAIGSPALVLLGTAFTAS